MGPSADVPDVNLVYNGIIIFSFNFYFVLLLLCAYC